MIMDVALHQINILLYALIAAMPNSPVEEEVVYDWTCRYCLQVWYVFTLTLMLLHLSSPCFRCGPWQPWRVTTPCRLTLSPTTVPPGPLIPSGGNSSNLCESMSGWCRFPEECILLWQFLSSECFRAIGPDNVHDVGSFRIFLDIKDVLSSACKLFPFMIWKYRHQVIFMNPWFP